MWPLLTILFALAALALAWRMRELRRRLRDLADLAEARTPDFLVEDDGLTRRYHLARVQRVLVDLATAHAKLARQEKGYLAQIEATLGTMKEAVLLVGANQRLMLANAAAAELLGADKVTPGLKPLEGAVRGAGKASLISFTGRCAARGRRARNLRCKSGGTR